MRTTMCLGVLVLVVLGSMLAACGGGSPSVTGEAAVGQKIYNANCALCHGQGGVGKPALGKDLRQNDFIGGLTDDEVVEFLKEGRRANHPLNERGVDMPPRGGNPGLSDENLHQVVAYLRGLS